jgi:hypothetical protein
MKRTLLLCLFSVGLVSGSASAQITVTLGGPSAVASAKDFATTVLQDPWDMNERTDVGWWLHSVDMPFRAFRARCSQAACSRARYRPIEPLAARIGIAEPPGSGQERQTFSINADLYRVVALRMRIASGYKANDYLLFNWSTNTIYDPPGLQVSGPVYTSPGWRIYFVDLASLGLLAGTEGWSGTKRSLRLDPAPDNATAGSVIDID